MPGPELHVLTNFENILLHNAIGKLSYSYREACILYYFNELSIAKIAALTKTSENTIKSRLLRARKNLYTLLKEGGHENV